MGIAIVPLPRLVGSGRQIGVNQTLSGESKREKFPIVVRIMPPFADPYYTGDSDNGGCGLHNGLDRESGSITNFHCYTSSVLLLEESVSRNLSWIRICQSSIDGVQEGWHQFFQFRGTGCRSDGRPAA